MHPKIISNRFNEREILQMSKRKVGYKETTSSDGSVNVRIIGDLASKLKAYGKSVNENASTIVHKALKEYLDNEQVRMLEQLSKEDLIKLLLNK